MKNNFDSGFLANICFIKEKRNYKIFIKNGKDYETFQINTPPMKIPFGIENFYGKELLNIEFTDLNKSNEVYNVFAKIKQLDFHMMSKRSDNNKKKFLGIGDKSYLSCVRLGKFSTFLRTHIRRTKNGYQTKFLNKDGSLIIDLSSLKGKKCAFVLSVDKLWINKKDYGVIIYVDSCRIV